MCILYKIYMRVFLKISTKTQGRIYTCEGPWAAFSSGAVDAHPTLEYQKIKGDKTYVETPWAAFSSGAVETHPTLEYQKIKGDNTHVDFPCYLCYIILIVT